MNFLSIYSFENPDDKCWRWMLLSYFIKYSFHHSKYLRSGNKFKVHAIILEWKLLNVKWECFIWQVWCVHHWLYKKINFSKLASENRVRFTLLYMKNGNEMNTTYDNGQAFLTDAKVCLRYFLYVSLHGDTDKDI